MGAPAPIRVANADVSEDAVQPYPRMVSPMTGQSFSGAGTIADEIASEMHASAASERASLSGQITRNAARIVLKAGLEAGE